MQINFAHLRTPATNGGDINFAVFGAHATYNTAASMASVLANLTMRARGSGLRVDQSALVYTENGRNKFFGDKNLVEYLSHRGIPRWTHTLSV